jgi:hypothetical protein
MSGDHVVEFQQLNTNWSVHEANCLEILWLDLKRSSFALAFIQQKAICECIAVKYSSCCRPTDRLLLEIEFLLQRHSWVVVAEGSLEPIWSCCCGWLSGDHLVRFKLLYDQLSSYLDGSCRQSGRASSACKTAGLLTDAAGLLETILSRWSCCRTAA